MGLIQVLDDVVADQIAAGEVVERPASVVKELLENAVDAGATEVTISIAGGGVERIRIVDNGAGMNRADLELCVVRHATSKLRTAADLDAIGTLGFRGEALPSIASVSRFSIRTKQAADVGALRLSMVGGREKEVRDASGPVGTEVVVEDLFFNVPARRKFLKTEATEAGHIQESVQRLSLCYPALGVRFQKDGRTFAEYPPGANLTDRVRQIFGPQYADGLTPVHVPGAFGLVGVLGRPSSARSTPRHYHLFINGRYVRDRVIMSAVQQAYGGRLARGKHPFVVLRLTLPAQAVDVNVHPAKSEVRFIDSRAVHRMVAKAVDTALRAAEMQAPAETPQKSPSHDRPFAGTPSASESRGSGPSAGGLDEHRNRIIAAMSRAAATRRGSLKPGRDSDGSTYSLNQSRPQNSVLPTPGRHRTLDKVSSSGTLPVQPALFKGPSTLAADGSAHVTERAAEPFVATRPTQTRVAEFEASPGNDWRGFEIVGWMDGLLVLRGADGFLFIDGKAAWRLIIFDRLKKTPRSEPLPTPVTVLTDDAESLVLSKNESLLKAMGFEWEPFGGGTQLIRKVPEGLPKDRVAPALTALFGLLASDEAPDVCLWRLAGEMVSTSVPQSEKELVGALCKPLVKAPVRHPFVSRFLSADAWERIQ